MEISIISKKILIEGLSHSYFLIFKKEPEGNRVALPEHSLEAGNHSKSFAKLVPVFIYPFPGKTG